MTASWEVPDVLQDSPLLLPPQLYVWPDADPPKKAPAIAAESVVTRR
ncbi:MAG TPA: hypothetical protein VIR28_14605 [Achromobacter sp.]|nr:hypothetical protein [Achromobacter sp. MYb9]